MWVGASDTNLFFTDTGEIWSAGLSTIESSRRTIVKLMLRLRQLTALAHKIFLVEYLNQMTLRVKFT